MRTGPSCRTHSALYKPFTDSAKELSKLSPTVPIKATAPASVSRSEYRIEVYWVPASLLTRIRVNSDYAEVDVKPRRRGLAYV